MRGSVEVAPVKKMTEKRLKWYGHVKRRGEGHVLRRMLGAQVPGKRWRKRHKTTWKDSCKRCGKCGVKGGERTGQSGRIILKTILTTTDNEKSLRSL